LQQLVNKKNSDNIKMHGTTVEKNGSYSLCFTECSKAYCLAIHPHLQCYLLFVNNDILVYSLPSFSMYIYTHPRPSGKSLTNFVAFIWFQVSQPCLKSWKFNIFLPSTPGSSQMSTKLFFCVNFLIL